MNTHHYTNAMFAVLLFAIIDLAAPTQAHAGLTDSIKRFFSADAFNMDWAISFAQDEYSTTDPITFDLNFSDKVLGMKPNGSTVSARVNGTGAYTQIVSGSSSGSVSASVPSSGSTPNFLEFNSTTGGWFETSSFNQARFGEKEYVFTVPLDDNLSPTAPSVGVLSCTIGEQNDYTITSTDSDGDTIYYYAYISGEGLPERLPSSGYVSSGTSQTVSRTFSAEGVYTLYARAVDSKGAASSWTQASIACGDVCTHCTYDGGAPSVDVRAVPSIVRQGLTSEIVWTLANVYNCSVSGTNGDVWGWPTVRVQRSMTTSPINESVVYTVSCEDEEGNAVSDSTTVHVVPVWEEI